MAPQAAIAVQVSDPLLVDKEANCADGHQADSNGDKSHPWGWSTIIAFLFLTFNSAMAIVHSQGDYKAIAFVIFAYANLVALFACLTMYERASVGSPFREWLKVAIWLLTTLLTLAFSYKVAAVMPAPVAALVWLMAFTTIAGGFVAFFIYKEKK